MATWNVVPLGDAGIADRATVGGKAAALAAAAAAGLPVLPGFVIPADTEMDAADVRAAWEELSDGGRRPLVVRSSSPVEDGTHQSMAGLFQSVLDVSGWDAFVEAVRRVRASAEVVPLVQGPSPALAVLVQPLLRPRLGGVLFGIDPVSGERSLVVAAVEGGPDALVAGAVDGSRHVLTRRGRLRHASGRPRLRRRHRRALAALARRTEAVFGAPQDMEWAIDDADHVWLLQSRPVTAVGARARRGPVFGTAPLAETFPSPLSPLEADLWLEPIREAFAAVVRLTGTASRRRLARSPVVRAVDGWAVVDLSLLGLAPRPRVAALVDPRPAIARLLAAWRVGRMHAALGRLAADVLARADADLRSVPPPDTMRDDELLALLERARVALVSLHGHELLVGQLVAPDTVAPTAAGLALRALADARACGLDDEEIVRRRPEVLALVPPTVRRRAALPPVEGALPPVPTADAESPAVLREALRLRVRWVQELEGLAVRELAARLVARGALAKVDDVASLRLDDLVGAIRTGALPEGAAAPVVSGTSPPPVFRLARDGRPVPLPRRGGRPSGVGVAGGTATGRVVGPDAPDVDGAILVVGTLDPALATLLPRVAGVVSETGSALSHLAILARELAVPVVVGVRDARSRFAAGSVVTIDGTSGSVDTRGQLGGAA